MIKMTWQDSLKIEALIEWSEDKHRNIIQKTIYKKLRKVISLKETQSVEDLRETEVEEEEVTCLTINLKYNHMKISLKAELK